MEPSAQPNDIGRVTTPEVTIELENRNLEPLRPTHRPHARSRLVRSGALVIVVDGFDELIGSVGSYDEAFGSLASFISDLGGGGCIIAAARSAYYEQEFLTRANNLMSSGESSWILRPVKLVEWNDTERADFVLRSSLSRDIRDDERQGYVNRVLAALNGRDVRYIGHKPFFVSKVAEILSTGDMPDGSSLLDRLVWAYMQREVNKLRSTDTNLPILSEHQYLDLLVEIAEEMWRQEARQLDRISVREVGELLGELLGVSSDGLAEVVERLPYTAFLTSGSVPGSIGFTHDIFYSYFLAEPVAKTWDSGDSDALRRLLRRGRLPDGASNTAGKRLYRLGTQNLLDLLSSAANITGSDHEQVRRNAGSLAASLLSDKVSTGLLIRGLTFGDASLDGAEFKESHIISCEFLGTDLTSTVFDRCFAEHVRFERVIIQPEATSLSLAGATVEDFIGLGLRDRDRIRWLYSPIEIGAALAGVGLESAVQSPVLRAVDEDIVQLVDGLCRLFGKTNSITEEDSNEMQTIVASPMWKSLRTAMLHSGVLKKETKATSGRKVFLTRLARPHDIMAGLDPDATVPDSVSSMWDLLEQNFPG